MREIKFNAWVPDLKLMLYNVTIYSDGTIGMCVDDFQSYIDEMPKHIKFIDDGVYYSDEDHFELLLTILPGEDWICLDNDDVIPLQYTGLKDKNGKEIYEGNILNHKTTFENNMADRRFQSHTELLVGFENGCFIDLNTGINLFDKMSIVSSFKHEFTNFEIIGNIYENPELLK